MLVLGGAVYLWSGYGHTKVGKVRPFSHPSSIDLLQDGKQAVVKNTAGKLAIVNLPSLEVRHLPTLGATSEGCQALISPCGQFVVDGSWDGELVVRSLVTGVSEFREHHENAMMVWLSCDHTRDTFVYVRQPKAVGEQAPRPSEVIVRRWPFSSNEETMVRGPWGNVHAASPSPEATHLAVLHQLATGEVALDVVEAETSRILATSNFEYGGTNHSLAWSPDGRILATVQRGRAAFFESRSLSLLGAYEIEHPCWVEFSPNGEYVALGSWDKGTIKRVAEVLG
ncbi:hypothetical protein AAW51_5246 [Caldimonas brevitalea]|uniref:WD40 repeat domain-containing protein n=1 Tax=Caldimonas brevitalea TaxID=413882 RepID=A0A0G3BR87_9BURK|nr:hypothetical protein AAW51_5246 [Caldimonas brevitalea]